MDHVEDAAYLFELMLELADSDVSLGYEDFLFRTIDSIEMNAVFESFDHPWN